MRFMHLVAALGVLLCAACHPGPVIDTGTKPVVGGTIAGIVSTEANSPVAGRKVTAVDVKTSQRYEATTGTNGGYTIKVPIGTYRLELELQAGEAVSKQPSETQVNNSDLDPGRDFVITARRGNG